MKKWEYKVTKIANRALEIAVLVFMLVVALSFLTLNGIFVWYMVFVEGRFLPQIFISPRHWIVTFIHFILFGIAFCFIRYRKRKRKADPNFEHDEVVAEYDERGKIINYMSCTWALYMNLVIYMVALIVSTVMDWILFGGVMLGLLLLNFAVIWVAQYIYKRRM
jgi:hypothetical protein